MQEYSSILILLLSVFVSGFLLHIAFSWVWGRTGSAGDGTERASKDSSSAGTEVEITQQAGFIAWWEKSLEAEEAAPEKPVADPESAAADEDVSEAGTLVGVDTSDSADPGEERASRSD